MAETSLSLDELTRKLVGVEDADVLRKTLVRVCARAHGRWSLPAVPKLPLRVAHEVRPEQIADDEGDDHRRRE